MRRILLLLSVYASSALAQYYPGSFNQTQMSEGVFSVVNGCDFLADYQNAQSVVNYAATSMAGCITVPSTSTSHNAIGGFFTVNNSSINTEALGVAPFVRALADGTGSSINQRVRLWGMNPLCSDDGHNHVFCSNEIDVNVTGPDTKVYGLSFFGASSQFMSSDSAAIRVDAAGAGFPWPIGYNTTDGSMPIAIQSGVSLTGNGHDGQLWRNLSKSSTGTLNVGDIYMDQNGYWDINNGQGGALHWPGLAFASLGTPANGTYVYCTNCAFASNPCAGAGTGAFAKRLNGGWVC
jgi:hypothetical protein